MEQIKAFIELIRAAFGPQIMAILGLTLARVILAVAVAFKSGDFDLKKLADFFRTMIIPGLLAWLACAILVQFVLSEYLGDLGPMIGSTAFLALVGSYVAAIVQNLQELGVVMPQRAQGLLKTLGIQAEPVSKTMELPF